MREGAGVVPRRAEELLRVVGARLGEVPRLLDAGPGLTYWMANTPRHHVYLSADPDGRAHIEREARRLAWAAAAGLPVPAVLDVDENGYAWVVCERVRSDPPRGPAYVAAAVAAAEAVAVTPPPPPDLLEGSEPRRAPRRGVPLRALRLAAAGIDLVQFRRIRRRALSLPGEVLAHGDFQVNNVLFDAAAGRVHLTDFEYLGVAPRGTDLLHLWCTLDLPEDRQSVVEAVLRGTDRAERERLAVLHRWISLRTLGESAALPRRLRDPAGVRRARLLAGEARRNAADWLR